MPGRAIDIEKAKAAILQALRAASTREAAAEYAGVHRATFYRWLEDATFATQVKEAEASWQVEAPALIFKAARNGSWQAASFILERHPLTKSQWKRIDQHDMSSIPTPRLLEMLSVAEEGAESPGDHAASAEAESKALPE